MVCQTISMAMTGGFACTPWIMATIQWQNVSWEVPQRIGRHLLGVGQDVQKAFSGLSFAATQSTRWQFLRFI